MSEPLDPCPVCGSEVHTDVLSLSDKPPREGVVCQRPCLYYNLLSDHRRLCAEVALAWVVETQGDSILNALDLADVHELNGQRWYMVSDVVERAIERVREASK